MCVFCLNYQRWYWTFQEVFQSHWTKMIDVSINMWTMQGLCLTTRCQWIQLYLTSWILMKMKSNDQMHLVDKISKLWTCAIELVRYVDPWFLWLGFWCWNASQRGQSLIGLQMNHKFMKCLIFLFNIFKDNKDFFHKCKHDYEHHEKWHQQEMDNPQP
jgi:hypothetical protein